MFIKGEKSKGGLSLRGRLLLATALVCFASLLLATSTIVLESASSKLQRRREDLGSVSDMTASAAQAPLAFSDADAAQEVLQGLRFKPFISRATMVSNNGTPLAAYFGKYTNRKQILTTSLDGFSDTERIWTLSTSVELDGKVLGRIILESDNTDIDNSIANEIFFSLLVLLISFGASVLLSTRVYKKIMTPLTQLISTTHLITVEKNYSVRILDSSRDELGILVQQFNGMLSEIEKRDANLENQVLDRTKALEASKDELAKALLKAEALAKTKSEFLANMSHEIRTPLNGVLGMLDLLLETTLDDEQREFARTAKTSGALLLSIVNDVLDFSKIEAGKYSISQRPFSPIEMVEKIRALLEPKFLEKKLEFECTLDTTIPDYLIGDSYRITQVLLNLIGNSIKFTPDEGIVILYIRKVAEDSGTVELLFNVCDSGIGIPNDKLKVIFDAFTQVDASNTRQFGGTGLGLGISSKIVSLMGGELTVKSKLGVGSNFSFKIPLEVCSVPINVRDSKAPKRSIEGSLCVLLVEDNEVNQKLATMLLKKRGHKVSVANNGVEAVELFQREKFDIILMDVQMPEMDGFTATRTIRDLPGGGSVPIVALTAHALEGDEEKCLAAGMDGYVSKPINKQILYDQISGVVAKKGK